jgi:four helix bundle protein
MMEASETQTWLEFSLKYKYISATTFDQLDNSYENIIKMLNSMIINADKFCYN